MIEKYFEGVITQVYNQVQIPGESIVMAFYGNDFSADGLEYIKRYSRMDNVFLLIINMNRTK